MSEAPITFDPSKTLQHPKAAKTRKGLLSPVLIRLFFLTKLPAALFAGLRVRTLDENRCEATVPYGWRTKNPFQSMYFAVQAMAAELSTGAIAGILVDAAPQKVGMLIVNVEATFGKKGTSTVTFTCEDGPKLAAAIQETLRTGEKAKASAVSVGRMADGTEVSRFVFTWSFKRRGG